MQEEIAVNAVHVAQFRRMATGTADRPEDFLPGLDLRQSRCVCWLQGSRSGQTAYIADQGFAVRLIHIQPARAQAGKPRIHCLMALGHFQTHLPRGRGENKVLK